MRALLHLCIDHIDAINFKAMMSQGRSLACAAARRAAPLHDASKCLQVAQAVSTRVDILSPEYLIEIERLQDDVAPFPTSQVGFALPCLGSQASEGVRLDDYQFIYIDRPGHALSECFQELIAA